MQRFSRPWMLIVVVLLPLRLWGPDASAQPRDSVGRVTALAGSATVFHKDSLQPRPLALRSSLYQEDLIRTDAASKIGLTFLDGTVVNLGEATHLEITSYVYSPRDKTQTSLLSFPVGVLRAIVKQVFPRSTFEVTTATAVAAIRGTDWMGEVKADSTAIVVLQGKVAVAHARRGITGEVTLTEGMGTTVQADQPPSAPTQWGQARVNALLQATSLP